MQFDPVLRHMIASFRKSPNWDEQLDLELLRKLWPSLVGQNLAGVMSITAVHGSRIVVNVPDQIWRKQLVKMIPQLLVRMNQPWPVPWIKEIAFTYEN
jgi:hypothetical protein